VKQNLVLVYLESGGGVIGMVSSRGIQVILGVNPDDSEWDLVGTVFSNLEDAFKANGLPVKGWRLEGMPEPEHEDWCWDEVLEAALGHAKPGKGLLQASEQGDVEGIQEALRQGAWVNVRDVEKNTWDTPLHLAAVNGHAGAVRLLLEHGADVEARDREGKTPLDLARTEGYEEIEEILEHTLLQRAQQFEFDALMEMSR